MKFLSDRPSASDAVKIASVTGVHWLVCLIYLNRQWERIQSNVK